MCLEGLINAVHKSYEQFLYVKAGVRMSAPSLHKDSIGYDTDPHFVFM